MCPERIAPEQLTIAGVDPETASETDAYRIEHIISREKVQKLKDGIMTES